MRHPAGLPAAPEASRRDGGVDCHACVQSIGAAAATWALLDAVLLRPLPVQEPERLFVVGELRGDTASRTYDAFTYHYYPQFRDGGVFERVAAHWTSGELLLVATDGPTAPTSVAFVSYTSERATSLFQELRSRLESNAAVESASLFVSQGGMTSSGRLIVDGEPRRFPSTVFFTAIDERYLET